MVFFDNLKAACRANKTSPSALVLSFGMSKANVTNWKNGGLPSPDVLLKIADALGVSVDYLLGNEQKKPATKSDELDAEIMAIVSQMTAEQKAAFLAGLKSFAQTLK